MPTLLDLSNIVTLHPASKAIQGLANLIEKYHAKGKIDGLKKGAWLEWVYGELQAGPIADFNAGKLSPVEFIQKLYDRFAFLAEDLGKKFSQGFNEIVSIQLSNAHLITLKKEPLVFKADLFRVAIPHLTGLLKELATIVPERSAKALKKIQDQMSNLEKSTLNCEAVHELASMKFNLRQLIDAHSGNKNILGLCKTLILALNEFITLPTKETYLKCLLEIAFNSTVELTPLNIRAYKDVLKGENENVYIYADTNAMHVAKLFPQAFDRIQQHADNIPIEIEKGVYLCLSYKYHAKKMDRPALADTSMTTNSYLFSLSAVYHGFFSKSEKGPALDFIKHLVTQIGKPENITFVSGSKSDRSRAKELGVPEDTIGATHTDIQLRKYSKEINRRCM